MIVNQQLGNTSVARQTELARDEQFAIAYLLSASVALQRMQVSTREIRLAISEREADQALAGLRGSMDDAVGYIQAAIQLCGNAENCERLESLVKLAKDYAAAAEMTALKKDYGEIAKPLDQINKIGIEINGLIGRVTSDARVLASQRMIAAAERMTQAGDAGEIRAPVQQRNSCGTSPRPGEGLSAARVSHRAGNRAPHEGSWEEPLGAPGPNCDPDCLPPRAAGQRACGSALGRH